MVITSTGYYATGSSAVYDLLREYSTCSPGIYQGKEMEHLLLYTPDGLFDLEDKLLVGNNIHRSDEAIDAFRSAMTSLYKNNFLWFGNFKHFYGEKFLKLVDEFVEEITDFKIATTWYYDCYDTVFSPIKLAKDIAKVVLHKKITGDFSKKIVYREKNGFRYSFIMPERFYVAAKKFISSFIDMTETEKNKKLILDHFLLPHNLYRLPNYFDDSIRVFVVERDPRDVFVQMMNRKHLRTESIPTDIDDYITFWRNLRRIERPIEDSRICRIWFEDLLYHYDETVEMIENFCGLDSADHIEPKKYFVPEKSIKNTRLYVDNTEYKEEIEKIERELPEYLYKG